jgi:hypothetical protein
MERNTLAPPETPSNNRRLRLLVAATSFRPSLWAETLVVRLSKHPHIEMRAVVMQAGPRLSQTVPILPNSRLQVGFSLSEDEVAWRRQQAHELIEWADMMACVPFDGNQISELLNGGSETVLDLILKEWNTEKSIIMAPGSTPKAWSSSDLQRQLRQVECEMLWIKLMAPILSPESEPPTWNSFDEVLYIITSQAKVVNLNQHAEVASVGIPVSRKGSRPATLPREIWTMILDYTGDWELAKYLGVWTNLPLPSPWATHPKPPGGPAEVFEHELEWALLESPASEICKKLSEVPESFHKLSDLMVKLIIRFTCVEVLAYLEAKRPDLLSAFGGTVLTTNASVFYPRLKLLDYWKGSKWFGENSQHGTEAVDGASKNGHTRVLDWWWRQSGHVLQYTNAALEQASANGHLAVLDWWHDAAAKDQRIVLRQGRALLLAAQHGRIDILLWWANSGLPMSHEERLMKTASMYGCVEVLETWRRLRGAENLVFDEDVLLAPALRKHIDVLKWWFGLAHGRLQGMDGQGRPVAYGRRSLYKVIMSDISVWRAVRPVISTPWLRYYAGEDKLEYL